MIHLCILTCLIFRILIADVTYALELLNAEKDRQLLLEKQRKKGD